MGNRKSDGWQSLDCFAIRFFAFERKNPSLKETKVHNSTFTTDWSASRPTSYTAGWFANHTALLPTNFANWHIACRCYNNPAIYKPWIQASGLCSIEHSKVWRLKMNWAAENLMFAGTYLATFRELLPPKSRDLQSCEIFLGKYSFVLNKINTFALNSIDWLWWRI